MIPVTHTIFNGPLELGTRSSLILTILEKRLSLDDLVLLDYALLYSQDFGGPENLHPALPNHIAEIGHRREFLPESLSFFSKRGLISAHIEESGYYYSANQQTLNFVSCLKSEYYRKSWIRLGWLKKNHRFLLEKSFPNFSG
mgnify:CR=1 FL=1